MIYWGFYPSCVRHMPLNRRTLSTKKTKRMVELALEVPLSRFLTSQVSVSLCLRMCQNTHKNSRETVAHLRRLTANLSWLLPSSCSKVSILDKRPPDLIDSHEWRFPKYLLDALPEWFYGSSESTAHYFPPIIKQLFLVKRMSAVKWIFLCCQLL